MPKINDLELIGAKELRALLAALPGRVRKKVIRQSLNVAATPIVKQAKKLAPKETGALRKSIGKRVKMYPSGTGVAVIGPRKDYVQPGGVKLGSGKNVKIRRVPKRIPRYYAHLVEFGHVDEGGNEVAPKPFLRPAFDAKAGESLKAMKQRMAAGVAKEAAKQSGKSK